MSDTGYNHSDDQDRETTSPAETEVEAESETATSDVSADELLAEVELLRKENQRLRNSYVQATTTQYRRVAVGFGVLGAMATLSAVLFPMARTVLLALGATGLFTSVLTYYLTPERFVAANIGAEVYDVLATNQDAVVTELGLENEQIYVPVGDTHRHVKLFIPQHKEYTIPDDDTLQSVFVVTEDDTERGIAVEPTGNGLFSEFERALDGPLGSTVPELTPQLRDGIVEQFEIADNIAVGNEDSDNCIIVEVQNDIYGDLSRFDHPVKSFLAVGFAHALNTPVRVTATDDTTSTLTLQSLKQTE